MEQQSPKRMERDGKGDHSQIYTGFPDSEIPRGGIPLLSKFRDCQAHCTWTILWLRVITVSSKSKKMAVKNLPFKTILEMANQHNTCTLGAEIRRVSCDENHGCRNNGASRSKQPWCHIVCPVKIICILVDVSNYVISMSCISWELHLSSRRVFNDECVFCPADVPARNWKDVVHLKRICHQRCTC